MDEPQCVTSAEEVRMMRALIRSRLKEQEWLLLAPVFDMALKYAEMMEARISS